MIVLFTDCGPAGPYTGQMVGVLLRENPDIPVIDLLADAPSRDPRAAAWLLAVCARDFPPPGVCHDADQRIDRSWPDSYPAIIYLDHYGNAVTGVNADDMERTDTLEVADQRLAHAATYGEVSPGQAFWYENSMGMVEIAVNCGSAHDSLGLKIGDRIAGPGLPQREPLQ